MVLQICTTHLFDLRFLNNVFVEYLKFSLWKDFKMSKDGNKEELQLSRDASSSGEKSWLFHRFPTRHTSPRVQHARRDMLQRQRGGNRTYFQVPKISANFGMGFQLQSKPTKEKSSDGTAERGCSETKLQKLVANSRSMPIDSFLVGKYELKERYKFVEIHKKVCKHCSFQNVIYKVKDNADSGSYVPGDSIYGRDPATMRWNGFSLSEDLSSTDGEAKAMCLPTSIQPKRKLVVQMPNIRNSVTSQNEDAIDYRPLFTYTHKKF